MKRNHLSMTIGLVLGLLAAPWASAQDAPATAPAADGEIERLDGITVTARRREESIQDVPVSGSFT